MSEQIDLCNTGNPTEQSPLNVGLKDKFVLVLNLPNILKKEIFSNNNVSIDPVQFTIFGAIVPSIQVPHKELSFGGQTLNISTHFRPAYTPLTVNFAVDNQFKNYWILWKWLSILNGPLESSYQGSDSKLMSWKDRIDNGDIYEYQSNFSILSKNEYNKTVVEFQYFGGFITSLGQINYDYKNSEIIDCSAEFQFNQFNIKTNFE